MRKELAGQYRGLQQAGMTLMMILCAALLAGPSHAQGEIDTNALLQETQLQSRNSDDMTLIWWIPEEFWQASFAQNARSDRDKTEEFLGILRRYTMVAVVDGRIGAFGGVTYLPEEVIRGNITLRDARGEVYLPLGEADIDANTKNLVQMLKPMLANMLGAMGQNVHFVLFPGRTTDGRAIANAKADGAFTVALAGKAFTYRLPLGSVLPPKYDPKTGERFPGNYKFSPFTGAALTVK